MTPDRGGRPGAGRAGVAAALLGAVALLAIFVVLALASGPDSALSGWDRRVSDGFIAWRTPGRSQFFWAITLLGNAPMLAALAFSVVLLLAVWGRRAHATLVAVGLLIGWGVSEVAKAVVGRPRPPVDDALIAMPSSGSMPSGHALTTLVFLALLVYVAFRWRRGGLGWAWAALVVAAVIAGLIGVSRIYLGVHWLSDVLGGWVLGGAWLLVFLSGIWRYLRHVRSFAGVDSRLSAPRPPARVAVRIAAVVFAVILCVAAYILTAHADPLLTDL